MNHQGQLEKKKYRNWVRGGLAYKYLKEGIEGFADDVVQQEHTRILSVVSHAHGLTCNQCCHGNLRPLHTCKKDHAGRNKCPWGQSNCNCVYSKKKKCPKQVCDSIMEDILRGHGSTPPTPKWTNTDVQKWCSAPWEITKCYINAPGYSDKTKASDIDSPGLLHIFINNLNLQAHFSDKMNGSDTFKKLKQESFIITTHEAEVCRDALASITNKSEELKHSIQDAKDDIVQKQTEAVEAIGGNVKECRDAVATVTNKSEELTQSIQDAKDDIEKKQTEVTKVIEDKTGKAIQELDKHNETLHERVGRLESVSSTVVQRLSMLGSRVDELDNIRQNHQRHLEYVEGKQVLQKKLVELYQSHYVKTSITPLRLQESNINIQEVYVAPEMVVEEKPDQSATASAQNATNKPNFRPVTGYREILQTNGQKHKQVYIVGDVGTGKSTFSRMMIQNWCSAVTADSLKEKSKDSLKSNDEYEKDSDHVSPVNDGNINEMRNYNFLFFVPLQRMSGLSDVTEMIKAIITADGIASNNFIDRIFEKESECCLIVADGLDEWTPPKAKSVLQHVSYGLPSRARTKRATIVTLSRPSAKGILNMRSSECDQKVELLGINAKSVVHFTKTYLKKLNKKGRSYEVFMEKINSAKLDHLEKTPLLLQQLVWLYGNGIEVGKSTSDTYSHLLNIILGWSQKREEGNDIECQNCDTKQDKDMILPRLLRRFPRCEEKKGYLLPLARVAFEALTSETGSVNFGRSHLQQKCAPNEAIDAVIKLGLLVENNCFDPTLEYTQLEFIHISYLEFLAAVYVSSHFNEHKRSILSNTVLQDLFKKCKSAADVLQLSNVLKMICGLSPFLLSEISKSISDIVNGDESMISYRNSLQKYWYMYNHVSGQIQRLILNCLSECDSDDQPMVSLCDVIIHSSTTNMSFLQRIKPENVISLHAFAISGVEVWRWIVRLTRLRFMYIGYSEVPHSEMVLLSSLIQEAPLKYLSLYRVECNYSFCNGHNIDLSKNDQLQKLDHISCGKVMITNINTKRLETLRLERSNISNIDCLLNAGSLTELVLRTFFCYDTGYDERVNNVVHTLHKLRKLKLEFLYIADSALTVTPEMGNLEHIVLKGVRMNLQTWRSFVDSLLTLQHYVQVDYTYSHISKRNYVRRNIKFEVIKDDDDYFNFRTKK